jgi:hypothetical protein
LQKELIHKVPFDCKKVTRLDPNYLEYNDLQQPILLNLSSMRPNPNLNQAGVHKKEMRLCHPASDLAILIVKQYAIPKTILQDI